MKIESGSDKIGRSGYNYPIGPSLHKDHIIVGEGEDYHVLLYIFEGIHSNRGILSCYYTIQQWRAMHQRCVPRVIFVYYF